MEGSGGVGGFGNLKGVMSLGTLLYFSVEVLLVMTCIGSGSNSILNRAGHLDVYGIM